MAAVARVEIRGCGKLSGMPVLVAIRAHIKLQPIQRVLALGYMALSTLKSCVAGLERILGRGVFLDGEKRRFPALDVMAGRTLAAIWALRELSLMLIFVAVRALLKRNGLFKVPVCVTLSAFDGRVLSFQRILCLRVVELFADARERDLLPSTG